MVWKKKKREGIGLWQCWADTVMRRENSSLFLLLPLYYLITCHVTLLLFPLVFLALGFVTG